MEIINAFLKRNGMTFFSIFPVTVYPGTDLAKQFVLPPFKSGIDAHLPEIIRDDLGISGEGLLNTPYNSFLDYKQLVDLVRFAYRKVEQAEITDPEEIRRLIQR